MTIIFLFWLLYYHFNNHAVAKDIFCRQIFAKKKKYNHLLTCYKCNWILTFMKRNCDVFFRIRLEACQLNLFIKLLNCRIVSTFYVRNIWHDECGIVSRVLCWGKVCLVSFLRSITPLPCLPTAVVGASARQLWPERGPHCYMT